MACPWAWQGAIDAPRPGNGPFRPTVGFASHDNQRMWLQPMLVLFLEPPPQTLVWGCLRNIGEDTARKIGSFHRS
jgi:hypothetical protein